jgi:DNA-binding PadR family transcriptional regulator
VSRDFRDDAREAHPEREVGRPTVVQSRHRATENDLFGRHLDLPRGQTRERVDDSERTHLLGESDMRTLATIGAFRVVPVDDLEEAPDLLDPDLRRLSDEGLITCETLTRAGGSERVASLTSEGKAVLEACRIREGDGPNQAFYAGVVKPRELAHDAQVYRAFKQEQARIDAEGGRVTRVVLDYELKRDYQRFLNRADRPDDATLESDRRAFADAHDLHVVRGHLELPDLRIEYETEDGRVEHRDVEVVTEHYSRGQISGKTKAGFACYRAGGSSSRGGGTPFDPRHLTRLS